MKDIPIDFQVNISMPEHGKNGWVLEDYEYDEKLNVGVYEYSHPSVPGQLFYAQRSFS